MIILTCRTLGCLWLAEKVGLTEPPLACLAYRLHGWTAPDLIDADDESWLPSR
jgi:hypothetical protein